jgi:hypothetical protein
MEGEAMTGGPGNRYRFRSDWWDPSPPPAVYAVLARGEDYPRWWPQIREAVPTGPGTGRCRFRSVLPFELSVTVRAGRDDPDAGVLQAELTGDLVGWVRWTLSPAARGGTRVTYEQDTELRHPLLRRPLLRRLAWAARPVLRANHALMMRAGRRGLRAAARHPAR